MNYDPTQHHRRTLRLRGYDYSRAGAYFVTICTANREYRFGEIDDGAMKLNDAGQAVNRCWNDIPNHFPHATLDEFLFMPNHINGIVFINNTPHTVGTKNFSSPKNVSRAKGFSPLPLSPHSSPSLPQGTSKTIGSIVRGFKIGVTKWIRQHTSIHDVWQRNYWEHVIRNDTELDETRQYIQNNPKQWELDDLYHPG